MRIKEIAKLLNSEVNGDLNFEVRRISDIKDAEEGDLVLFFNEKRIRDIPVLQGLAAIIPDSVNDCSASAWIKVKDVKASMIELLKFFYPEPVKFPEDHLIKDEDFKHIKTGSDIKIGKNVFIGKNCVFGDNVKIFPFSYIGNNVEIGNNSVIYPHTVILDGTELGQEVIIYPGVVIGSDGFGYYPVKGELKAIPHVGRVIIGDRVEIGALSMVDRGTIGNTVIGDGTKIDNSVHIAHNVKIGKNVIILAQVGIAGSCIIEDNVAIAGQVGIADHVRIGRDAKVAAKSGVAKDVEEGEVVFGYPADKQLNVMRNTGYFKRLPELFKRVRALEKSK